MFTQEQESKKHCFRAVKERYTEIWSNYTIPIYREGRSRKIISNDEDKANSGIRVKNHRTIPMKIGKGSCREIAGNSNGNTVTGKGIPEH